MAKILRYFLGANSPQGYVSRFDQLGEPGEWRCWLVKGGPGCGKSTLMSQVSRAMEPHCGVVEEILCTGSPGSLDGIIFPQYRLAIADATPPHTLEPQYPGAYERVVSLWGCMDKDMLYGARGPVIALAREGKRLRKSAGGYLHACGALLGDLASVGASAMDRSKTIAYARRLALREFPGHGSPRSGGKEQVRLLSAVTGQGTIFLRDTVAALAPRAIAIEDNWGAVSNTLLEALRDLALEAGLTVVTCRSPLFPFTKIDHLLLPQLGLGFLTMEKSTARQLEGLTERAIHAPRFCDAALLRERRARSAFLRKAAVGMQSQAAELLGQAEKVHHELEGYYRDAMDFAAVSSITHRVVQEFLDCTQT
jgi:energy-coupling factor transporter ATP-binding protein EcfA2